MTTRYATPQARPGTIAAVLFATAVAVSAALAAVAPAHATRWGAGYLPNVEVIDQDHRRHRFYDDLIKGRIVVISFVYTSCSSICPLTLARLAEVQERLGEVMGREIHFISVSIDPIPDTPDKLKEQARAFGARPGWTFVTGAPDDIDLIRYKLGERSGEKISQHKNEVLMFNDATGEWSRDSTFADLGVLAMNIRAMKPEWRNAIGAGAHDATLGGAETAASDGPGQALFHKACASCHTIGQGDKVGPDLSGLTSRRDRAWISAYLQAPDRLRKAQDRFALELRARYPAVRMPSLGLSEADAADVITYLESRK